MANVDKIREILHRQDKESVFSLEEQHLCQCVLFCIIMRVVADLRVKIPPRDGHPCLCGWTIPTTRAREGLTPVR